MDFQDTFTNMGNPSSFSLTIGSSISLYDDIDKLRDQQTTDRLFKIVLKKMKKTFSLANTYLTSSSQFLTSLVMKVDSKQNLVEFIKQLEVMDPEKSKVQNYYYFSD